MNESCGLLKKALVRRSAGQDAADPIQTAEKTVGQLCGRTLEWNETHYAAYHYARLQGLNMSEAKHAVRLAAALQSSSSLDFIHKLDQPDSPDPSRIKRKRQKSAEDVKRKKPKV